MLPAAAQKIEKDEYFLVVNSRQGLSDNCILQMMQLPDGRLAVRTRKGLDIYDGKHFVFVQLCADKMQRLPKYNGQTHLYADNQKRLWVKDYHQVYCVDLEKGKLEAPSLDWSNALYEGGQDIQRLCPIDIMPVFVKAGTILPFGPEVQYSSEKPWDELEIRVYPGADGTFTLYEDEGDNYNYEKGKFSEIKFSWNEINHTLNIAPRKGSFKGMLQNRKFHIVLVGDNSGVGDMPMPVRKTVEYNGKVVTVQL